MTGINNADPPLIINVGTVGHIDHGKERLHVPHRLPTLTITPEEADAHKAYSDNGKLGFMFEDVSESIQIPPSEWQGQIGRKRVQRHLNKINKNRRERKRKRKHQKRCRKKK